MLDGNELSFCFYLLFLLNSETLCRIAPSQKRNGDVRRGSNSKIIKAYSQYGAIQNKTGSADRRKQTSETGERAAGAGTRAVSRSVGNHRWSGAECDCASGRRHGRYRGS